MPILTMPFDEGVTGAVGGHKKAAGEAKQEYRASGAGNAGLPATARERLVDTLRLRLMREIPRGSAVCCDRIVMGDTTLLIKINPGATGGPGGKVEAPTIRASAHSG